MPSPGRLMVTVGMAEVLSPRNICSCHVLWESPLCCGSVGLGAWARLSRGGVRKCTRNAPQLAPHHVALRGRHNTGGMFTGWGIAGGALAGIVGSVCRAAGCFPWYKGFGRAFKRSVMGCSPFMELMGPLQWWTHALLKQGM